MSYSRFPARFGKYILLDRLNSGGMAEVYRAKVTGAARFQRLVAIKCMLPQLNEDEQFTTMFVDEAKLAAQLSHANIVQIYELGSINEQLYIAMELVNGHDLRHIIKRAAAVRTPIPVGFAAYVISKAGEALDFAHRKLGIDGSPLNLVHRDVSPQNILVSYDGEVKVVDFGIAKAAVRDTETRAGVLKGKFAYMAPEQVMGAETDRRADIFALGAVLYETLTGKKLFRGESDFSILEKVRAAEVPSIADVDENVPPEIDQILARALARDAEDRFPWASDLAEELAPFLIDDRSIFGAKQAREFIQSLYANDIEMLSNMLREYSNVTNADCVESSRPSRVVRKSQVFESDFSTLDDAIPDDLINDLEAGETTQLSGASPAPQQTGWSVVSEGPGADRDATLLYDDPSSAAAPIQPPQPAIQPQVLPQAMSAPVSGLSVAHNPVSTTKSVLIGLVAATVMILIAVVVVFITTRPGPSDTIVTPVTLPPTAQAPAPPKPTPTPVVGAEVEPETPTSPELPPTNDTVVPDDSEKKGSGRRRTKIGVVSIRGPKGINAKVYVDGKDEGFAPLVYHKLPIGKHTVKIIEVINGKPGRSKAVDVNVKSKHTRKSPLFLDMKF